MAIVQNPITGRTKQKFGTAVFSKQFGKNTMRTKPIEVANPKTPKQLEQRARFSLMVDLARTVLSFIRIGFKQVALEMSEFNYFIKDNIKEVIAGMYPAFTIDFTKLIVTKGTLTGADTPGATAEIGHAINVTWEDNSGYGDALATDIAMVLIINDTKGGIKADTTSRTRDLLFNLMTLPASWVGDQVHVYLSFWNADGTAIADSVYVDSLTVVA